MKIPTFERRNEIIRMLQEHGYVKAQMLAKQYQVSMETIRKDLTFLEAAGIAHREYGGASLSRQDIEQALPVRMGHGSRKKEIARCALGFLEDAKVVFLDAGTTVHELAKLLNDYRPLDIVTNSLLAWECLDAECHNVFLTGGKKREKNRSLTGSWCVQAIESVHADICFLGTSGILDRKGPTTHSYQELEAKKAMVRQSERIYVLADSDKFRESGFHTMCLWEEIDGIITDGSLSAKTCLSGWHRRMNMKKIVKILPFYEPRMWGGGERLKNEFNYHTDVKPLGEVYNVVALQGHADCEVSGMDMTLSALYKQYPEWFNCDTEELPVRVNILDPMADLSVQLHPDDAFARAYNGGRGKPEAWVILDTTEEGRIQFGHKAKTIAEFKEKTEQQDWEGLLKYLKAVKDAFIDIPAGTLHAIGTGVLTYNISRNADCTLRLYDYDRIDPSTGKKRDIQPEQVYENVNMPDTSTEFVMYPSSLERGIHVTRYWDEPGLYTLMRLQVEKMGTFSHPRFAFYTCVDGEGTIQDVPIKKGETLLVPEGMGMLKFKGNMDVFLASYRNEED